MTNSEGSSDRNQVIYAELIARAWGDKAYKDQLLVNPRQTLTEAGMELPESGTIQVLENTEAVHYVVLPKSATFADFKDNIADGLTPLFPLSANQEIIIRQMTEDLSYIILPRKPQATQVEQLETAANSTFDVSGNTPVLVSNNLAVVCAVIDCSTSINSLSKVVIAAAIA